MCRMQQSFNSCKPWCLLLFNCMLECFNICSFTNLLTSSTFGCLNVFFGRLYSILPIRFDACFKFNLCFRCFIFKDVYFYARSLGINIIILINVILMLIPSHNLYIKPSYLQGSTSFCLQIYLQTNQWSIFNFRLQPV